MVCKGAKWIAGSYHLGKNLLGPEGYICLLQKLQQIPLGNRLWPHRWYLFPSDLIKEHHWNRTIHTQRANLNWYKLLLTINFLTFIICDAIWENPPHGEILPITGFDIIWMLVSSPFQICYYFYHSLLVAEVMFIWSRPISMIFWNGILRKTGLNNCHRWDASISRLLWNCVTL